jgi:hypothetical protein
MLLFLFPTLKALAYPETGDMYRCCFATVINARKTNYKRIVVIENENDESLAKDIESLIFLTSCNNVAKIFFFNTSCG